jgi:hypothetical protein
MLSINTPYETQLELAKKHKLKRKWLNHSRKHAAKITGVPESTIRRFEDSGEISLKQFLMLCNIYWDLATYENAFSKPEARTMDELVEINKKALL